MSKIEKFEDFRAWQSARTMTKEIYAWSAKGRISSDWGLKDQMRRASVSIMANISEGFERGRPTEFHQFLSIAKGSCAELRSHLYVAWDADYLSEPEFKHLLSKTLDVSNLVGALRTSVAARRDKPK